MFFWFTSEEQLTRRARGGDRRFTHLDGTTLMFNDQTHCIYDVRLMCFILGSIITVYDFFFFYGLKQSKPTAGIDGYWDAQ